MGIYVCVFPTQALKYNNINFKSRRNLSSPTTIVPETPLSFPTSSFYTVLEVL